jgi:hypothetical protein
MEVTDSLFLSTKYPHFLNYHKDPQLQLQPGVYKAGMQQSQN